MKPQIETLRIIEGKEKKEILKKLDEQFGIKKIPGLFCSLFILCDND